MAPRRGPAGERGAATPVPRVPRPAEGSPMSERAIFFQALDRDDLTEREAYLNQACAGDGALRQRVEALLRSLGKAGDFLATPALQQLAAGADTARCRETPSEGPKDPVPLDFLAPSRRPGSLGRLGHY